MRRVWPLAVGAVLLAGNSTLPAQQTLTRVQMDEDLRELTAVVRRAYAYVDEKKEQSGVDPDQLLANARKQLDGVKSAADFHRLLREFVAGLRDGHCEVIGGPAGSPKPHAWPFLLHFVKEGVVINGIHPALAGQGIEVGDLLREVDGRSIDDWVAEAAKTVSASSDGARRKMALQRAIATAAASFRVKVEHPDGRVATVTVKTGPVLRNPPEPDPKLDLPAGEFTIGRVLPGGVGYVRIPSFGWNAPDFLGARSDAERDAAMKPARDQIDAAFTAVADTESLVLDLRGNGGGSDLLSAYVLSHVLSGDFLYYTTQTRSSPELRKEYGSPSHLPAADGWASKYPWVPRKTVFSFYRGKPYPGRLAVLINETAFSATDCLCAVLADLHPRVRFVGRPTNAGAGGPTVLNKSRLRHSQAALQVCVMKVWSPKGRLIEGHGTRPDVPVEWTRDDVLRGRDPDVAAALANLAAGRPRK